jgi:hypothetical protein
VGQIYSGVDTYALGAVAALPNSVTTTSIVDGTIGTADINATQIQRRVTGSCPTGQYVRVVAQDGTVTCGTDATGSGTVTSIATGAGLTGGPITASGTISVAPGGIGTTEINATQVQRRVTGTCTGLNYVQQVNADGTVGCGPAPAASGWSLTGNAGTNPATNFIGTTDAQPFVVRTQNVQSLRIEPSTILFGGNPITANVIAGSSANNVTSGVRGATIGGGGLPAGDSDPDFSLEAPNRVTDAYGTVGGGYANQAGDDAGTALDSPFATVGGGLSNSASARHSNVDGGVLNTASGVSSTVGGGQNNTASADASTVGGGWGNIASWSNSTVGGGFRNTASGLSSTVGGGFSNTASGSYSTIGGGLLNCAGADYSWAGGYRAKVRPATDPGGTGSCSGLTYPGGFGDAGTFIWADTQLADLVSTGPNQFLVRAAGGLYFGTNSTVSIPSGRFINTSTGAHLTTGGTWVNASSRSLKTDFSDIDPLDVLGRVVRLGISTWAYRDSAAEGRHMGPVAEEFHALFGLGGDASSISTVDASGVALAAIQGLHRKLEAERDALRAENAALRSAQQRMAGENAELRARLERLEALVAGRASEER